MSWGSWIAHDGSGCPPGLIGLELEIECQFGCQTVSVCAGGQSWFWRIHFIDGFARVVCFAPGVRPIARYRVRRSSGMDLLREAAADPHRFHETGAEGPRRTEKQNTARAGLLSRSGGGGLLPVAPATNLIGRAKVSPAGGAGARHCPRRGGSDQSAALTLAGDKSWG